MTLGWRIVGWLGSAVATLLLMGFLQSCSRQSTHQDEPTTNAAHSAKAEAPEAPAPPKPATRPTAPLPENTTCLTSECHAMITNAKHIHGPLSSNNCFACHGPDTGGHIYPLKMGASDSCKTCHSVSGSMSNQHKALEKGCLICHQPHASQAKFLLKADSEKALCETCHKIETKEYQHEPFGRGDCSACHSPHQSDNKKLLKVADGSAQCARCHEATVRAVTSVKYTHKPATENCVSCHNPHSSSNKHQLKDTTNQLCSSCHVQIMENVNKSKFKHSPVANDSQCANCHNPHGSDFKPMLLARQDQLCLKCHGKAITTPDGREIPEMTVALTKSKYLHGPIRAGECTPCHDSHASEHRLLLREEFPNSFYTPFELDRYALCFKCHDKDLVLLPETEHLTGFRDGNKNMHYLHVNRDPKGRSCQSCHAIHGSNQPNHIAQKVQFDGSDWAMEINFVQTESGGTCQPGCHAKREYKRTAPLTITTQPTSIPTTQSLPTTQATGGLP